MSRHFSLAVALVMALVLAGAVRPAAGGDDPRLWLDRELLGTLRVGGGRGDAALAPAWIEGTSIFQLQASFTLRPVPGRSAGEIELHGKLEGTIRYRASTKGVSTGALAPGPGDACGGAIGPGSDVSFKLDTRDGTYVFDARARTKCAGYKITIQSPGDDDVEIDMSDMAFSVMPSIAALSKRFRLPESGTAFRGRSEMLIVPGGIGAPLEGTGEWSIEPAPLEVQVVPLAQGTPHCVCEKDVPIGLTATANAGGGTFGELIVESQGSRPEVLANTGGRSPRLVLRGAGRRTGATTVRAVYRLGDTTVASEPYALEFCDVDRPQLAESRYRIGGNRYRFGAARPVDLELGASTTAWRNGTPYTGPLEWTLAPFDAGIFEVEPQPGNRAAFRARKLPERNHDFGRKQLVARLREGACDCASEPLELVFFFDRDARNNPDGTRPNWAFYWPQTAAGVAGAPLEPVPAIPRSDARLLLPGASCLAGVLGAAEEGASARYQPMKDVVYLLETPARWTCAPRPDGTRDEGIDCFAVLARHELQHRLELGRWWGPRLARYSCAADRDGDLVPDSVEDKTLGCSPTQPWSCPTRPTHLRLVWDVDLDAYGAGWRWVRGTADREDWAYPGKQSGD